MYSMIRTTVSATFLFTQNNASSIGANSFFFELKPE